MSNPQPMPGPDDPRVARAFAECDARMEKHLDGLGIVEPGRRQGILANAHNELTTKITVNPKDATPRSFLFASALARSLATITAWAFVAAPYMHVNPKAVGYTRDLTRLPDCNHELALMDAETVCIFASDATRCCLACITEALVDGSAAGLLANVAIDEAFSITGKAKPTGDVATTFALLHDVEIRATSAALLLCWMELQTMGADAGHELAVEAAMQHGGERHHTKRRI